jgi:hypothetical protein
MEIDVEIVWVAFVELGLSLRRIRGLQPPLNAYAVGRMLEVKTTVD